MDQGARTGGRCTLYGQNSTSFARSREVSNALGGRAEVQGCRTCGAVGVGDVGESIVAADCQLPRTTLVQGDA